MPPLDATTGPLRDRVALVTGASSGIGRAIALGLGAAGATVIAVARDGDRLEAVATEAGAAGSRIEAVACDVTDDDQVRSLGERVTAAPGSLDILVHSAGTIEFGHVADVGIDQLERMIRTNLRAPYALTQVALPLLTRAGGDVVFVNSSAGVRPSAGVAAYGAAKHALRGFADALRDEVNPLGIRVTTIYPGRTHTPMQASVYEWEGRDESLEGLLEPADIAALVVSIVGLPRTAEVTDVHIRPARPPGRQGARRG
jgi:NAD(P)-dependent dehydrogenase (short-subunit alcohol dehydrogenase family)